MQKFHLAIEDVIEFPVSADIQSGRVKKNFFFHVEAKRLNTSELRRTLGPQAENPKLTVDDFLRTNIIGWRGQQLVLDENDKPIEFSPAALDAMLSVSGMSAILMGCYDRTMAASEGDAGRRKNYGG